VLDPQVVVNLLPEFGLRVDFFVSICNWLIASVHLYSPPSSPSLATHAKACSPEIVNCRAFLAAVANPLGWTGQPICMASRMQSVAHMMA
jgi:hypothetical protein